jgi:hypothetical protein
MKLNTGSDEFGTLQTETVEEYHYDNRSWTLVPTSLTEPNTYFGAVAVPALLFRDIPGGCIGVR